MQQEVSSSGRAETNFDVEVHAAPPDMQVKLSAQKDIRVIYFSRIHEKCSDNRPFLELSDVKAALLFFLISWVFLCMLFACNKET